MKFAKNVAFDLIIWVGIIFGLYQGVSPVDNIAVFGLWLMAALGILIGLFGFEAYKDQIKKGNVVRPESLHGKYILVSTMLEAMAIAGAEHYWLAGFYITAAFLSSGQKARAIEEIEQ